MRNGELMATGKVGGETSVEEAVACAQQCVLNGLAAIRSELVSLAAVKQVVKVVAYVASTPDFVGQPIVADGASEKALGRTHATHKSPYLAAAVQATVAIVTVALFAIGGAQPLLQLGTWLPIFCTLAVIVVQLVVSVAVIGYFNRVGRERPLDWWKTMLAPALGALAQGVVVWLLLQNITFLAGTENLVVKLIPLYVVVIAVGGYAYALWLRGRDRDRFESIGQLHDEELEEIFVDEMYVREGEVRD